MHPFCIDRPGSMNNEGASKRVNNEFAVWIEGQGLEIGISPCWGWIPFTREQAALYTCTYSVVSTYLPR